MSVSRCARACARTCVLLAYGGRDTGVHEEDRQEHWGCRLPPPISYILKAMNLKTLLNHSAGKKFIEISSSLAHLFPTCLYVSMKQLF